VIDAVTREKRTEADPDPKIARKADPKIARKADPKIARKADPKTARKAGPETAGIANRGLGQGTAVPRVVIETALGIALGTAVPGIANPETGGIALGTAAHGIASPETAGIVGPEIGTIDGPETADPGTAARGVVNGNVSPKSGGNAMHSHSVSLKNDGNAAMEKSPLKNGGSEAMERNLEIGLVLDAA